MSIGRRKNIFKILNLKSVIDQGGHHTCRRPGHKASRYCSGVPKCMAPVNNLPFLTYVIRHLISQGIEKFIFSLGYKHELIEEFLNTQFPTINFQCVIEEEPLDTGGAINMACKESSESNMLIVNGDTLFKINTELVSEFHFKHKAECTIALKSMQDFIDTEL